MKLNNLKLIGFRNYKELSLDFSDCTNIFIGRNAQGKTNILESVCYASMGSSFRANNDNDLIMWNSLGSSITLTFQRRGVENRLEFIFEREKRRKIIHNGNVVRQKELIGIFNAVLFSPEDLNLIKGAPAERRRFLDGEISQASPAYYGELLKYNRLLQQRNFLLKNIRERRSEPSMLDMWDAQLAECGIKIIKKRLEAVKKFNMLANLMQRRISTNEENLSVVYSLKGFDESIHNIEEKLNLYAIKKKFLSFELIKALLDHYKISLILCNLYDFSRIYHILLVSYFLAFELITRIILKHPFFHNQYHHPTTLLTYFHPI